MCCPLIVYPFVSGGGSGGGGSESYNACRPTRLRNREFKDMTIENTYIEVTK